MNIKFKKLVDYLSRINFIGDEEMSKIVNGHYIWEEPISEEEKNKIAQMWSDQIESLRKEHFHEKHIERKFPLIGYDDLAIKHDNFFLFTMLIEAIQEIISDLGKHAQYKEKKEYLNSISSELKNSSAHFLSTTHLALKHFDGNENKNLSKSIFPENLWALLELHKRYFNALSFHVDHFYYLIQSSINTLIEVPSNGFNRLIWITKEGTQGVNIQSLRSMLIQKGYIATIGLTKFKDVFRVTGKSFEKITWLGTVAQLHFLVDELIDRRILVSTGTDVWVAAVNSFKQENNIDYNYSTLKRDTSISSIDKKEILSLLHYVFGRKI